MIGVIKRCWIWIVLVVVLTVSALVVSRVHKIFGSQDLNANAGAGIEIVQFNPKVVTYEVSGSPGTTSCACTKSTTATSTCTTTT